MPRNTPPPHEIGGKKDVEITANEITPREINALTFAGEPFTDRREALERLIDELTARIEASEEGAELEPLLRDAENALAALDASERKP